MMDANEIQTLLRRFLESDEAVKAAVAKRDQAAKAVRAALADYCWKDNPSDLDLTLEEIILDYGDELGLDSPAPPAKGTTDE